jgi:uncharacterized protein YbjT (DUF2867 family)
MMNMALTVGALAAASSSSRSSILVVGASGGTGMRALNGLLDVGYEPNQLRVMSRSVKKPFMRELKDRGFATCRADLDDKASLRSAVTGCTGCYIHSTSSDTKQIDEREVERARNLAAAILAVPDSIQHVIYNSAAGEPELCGVRKGQKHSVEEVFLDDEFDKIKFTSLRANLFMEELWKSYTRPAILKGKFTFCVPSNRDIYLTSVRDMGRLAGACLQSPDTTAGRRINVAGDVLTPREMAAEFAKAQGTPCKHSRGRFMALLTRLFFRSLWDEIYFLRKTQDRTDIQALAAEFPGLLTSFSTFLNDTKWADKSKTFEDFQLETFSRQTSL